MKKSIGIFLVISFSVLGAMEKEGARGVKRGLFTPPTSPSKGLSNTPGSETEAYSPSFSPDEGQVHPHIYRIVNNSDTPLLASNDFIVRAKKAVQVNKELTSSFKVGTKRNVYALSAHPASSRKKNNPEKNELLVSPIDGDRDEQKTYEYTAHDKVFDIAVAENGSLGLAPAQRAVHLKKQKPG